MVKIAVMSKRVLFVAVIFLLFGCAAILPVSADTGGYVVRPATPDMVHGPSQELARVPLWEHPPRVLAIYLALFLSPFLVYPIEIFFLLKLFSYLGYRKIARKNVLENSSRSVIFHYIRESPGTDFTEISRETGVSTNTLRYHIAVLKLTNKITALETTRNARYYENSGCYPVMEQKVLKYLRNKPTRTLLQSVKEKPRQTRVELETAMGISGPGVSWHIRRLSEDGIITNTKVGRNNHYELNPDVIPHLDKYLPMCVEDPDKEKNG